MRKGLGRDALGTAVVETAVTAMHREETQLGETLNEVTPATAIRRVATPPGATQIGIHAETRWETPLVRATRTVGRADGIRRDEGHPAAAVAERLVRDEAVAATRATVDVDRRIGARAEDVEEAEDGGATFSKASKAFSGGSRWIPTSVSASKPRPTTSRPESSIWSHRSDAASAA